MIGVSWIVVDGRAAAAGLVVDGGGGGLDDWSDGADEPLDDADEDEPDEDESLSLESSESAELDESESSSELELELDGACAGRCVTRPPEERTLAGTAFVDVDDVCPVLDEMTAGVTTGGAGRALADDDEDEGFAFLLGGRVGAGKLVPEEATVSGGAEGDG